MGMTALMIDDFNTHSELPKFDSYFAVIKDLVCKVHDEVKLHQAMDNSAQTLDALSNVVKTLQEKMESSINPQEPPIFFVEAEIAFDMAEKFFDEEFSMIISTLKQEKVPFLRSKKHKILINKAESACNSLLDFLRFLKQFHTTDEWDRDSYQKVKNEGLDVLGNEKITLSENDWVAFMASMEVEPKKSPALEKAIKNYQSALSA
jgi:hypothetical protein